MGGDLGLWVGGDVGVFFGSKGSVGLGNGGGHLKGCQMNYDEFMHIWHKSRDWGEGDDDEDGCRLDLVCLK